MSTENDWLKAREDYANRIPDPDKPKLPQSGNWLDHEIAFFLNRNIETFREQVRNGGIPRLEFGNQMVFHIDEFVRGRLYGEETEKPDDQQTGKRKRVDLAKTEREVRRGSKRAGNAGQEKTEGDGGDVRPRKGRKGPAAGGGK